MSFVRGSQMHRPRCQTWALTVMLCALATVVIAQEQGAGSHLSAQHKAVVDRWLSVRKLSLRIAAVSDNLNEEGLANTRKERGKDYHPYYAVGDFNGDRKQDFAVALINDKKRNAPFAIAIFNGPFGKNAVPAYFDQGWDIADGGMFEGGAGLMVGPFESDNCVVLKPRGKRYVIRDCL